LKNKEITIIILLIKISKRVKNEGILYIIDFKVFIHIIFIKIFKYLRRRSIGSAKIERDAIYNILYLYD
jgi:hypothetical protein